MKYKLNTTVFDEYQIKYNPNTRDIQYLSFTELIQNKNASFSGSILAWLNLNIHYSATPEGLRFWKQITNNLYYLSKQQQIEKLTKLLIGTKFVLSKEPCYEI